MGSGGGCSDVPHMYDFRNFLLSQVEDLCNSGGCKLISLEMMELRKRLAFGIRFIGTENYNSTCVALFIVALLILYNVILTDHY